MIRGALRVAVLCVSVALFGGLALHFNLAQAHGPGGTCDGHCQDLGSANFAAPNSTPYFQQPAYPAPSAYYGQGLRTFANMTASDCPICRAEQAQAQAQTQGQTPAAAPNQFAAPHRFDASMDRPRLPSRHMSPRQSGYPLGDPYARGMRPNMPRAYPGPNQIDPDFERQERSQPKSVYSPQPVFAIPDGMALVLQDDSPLMSGGEQLGSIDRDQTLRVLNIQGNWVQLETNWLGKNTWIRRNLVRMNDNIPPPNDIAPPAT